jgi:diguanylate cyclase (GGDEF)-like protein
VNDTHGHLMGDRVLKGLTQLTLRLLRNVDDLGRWGGEEFLILLPETDVVGAQRLAERVRSALAQQRFDIAGSVTASFGVTTYLPNDTLETMLHRADEALYQAKREGRNRVAVSLATPHAPTT